MIWLFSFIFKRLSSPLRLQRCHFHLSAEVMLLSHFFEHAQNRRGGSRKSQYCFLFLILSSRSIFSFLWLMQRRVPCAGVKRRMRSSRKHTSTKTLRLMLRGSSLTWCWTLCDLWTSLWLAVNVMLVESLTTCGALAHKIFAPKEVISTDNNVKSTLCTIASLIHLSAA